MMGLILVAASALAGGEPLKDFVIEEVVNEKPGFMIRVAVDHEDRIYYEGETMTITVQSEKDCYLYLLYVNAEGDAAALFPNKYQPDNLVRGGEAVQVPAQGDSFRFRASAPFGQELLHVVATLEPIKAFADKSLTSARVTPLTGRELRKGMDVIQSEQSEEGWAEARIEIETRPGTPTTQKKRQKRYAVCIGVSEYSHERIPQLQVCHLDAEMMADSLEQVGGADEVVLLTNKQATKEAIRQAIFEQLPQKVKPGDTVVLYFSCHGGRTSDTNGDEADGMDEYLVPHDGIFGEPETMILDDTFARWIGELDGCKVLVVMDNCYSGGTSKATGSPKGLPGPPVRRLTSFDFIDGELKRAKDLGMANTCIIAASKADQLAWEMPTGEGSVLTHFLLRAVADPAADTNGDGKVGTREAYDYLTRKVEDYVRDSFQAEQNPVLIDNADDTIFLKP